MFFFLANMLAEHPPDIWHDPNTIGLLSLGIGIAAILVAVAVGIYQVRQGRVRRKLVYQTLSNAPIVSVKSAVANQVEIDIRVKGTLVKDVHLLVVNIKNAGKVSIHASDYFEPLTFEFNTKVLQASILETTPPTLIHPSALPTFLTLTSQSVQFPAFPLNPGDIIQMSILLEGKGTLKARGRLDQGTVVELEQEMRSFANFTLIPAAVAVLAMLATLALVLAEGITVLTQVVGTIGILMVFASLTLALVGSRRTIR